MLPFILILKSPRQEAHVQEAACSAFFPAHETEGHLRGGNRIDHLTQPKAHPTHNAFLWLHGL